MRSDAVRGEEVALLDGVLMMVMASEVEDSEKEWEGSQDSADGPAPLESNTSGAGAGTRHQNQDHSSSIESSRARSHSLAITVRVDNYEIQQAKRPSPGNIKHWHILPRRRYQTGTHCGLHCHSTPAPTPAPPLPSPAKSPMIRIRRAHGGMLRVMCITACRRDSNQVTCPGPP